MIPVPAKIFIITMAPIVSWAQLFVVIYPGYNFSRNVIGFAINALLGLLLMMFISFRLGPVYGLFASLVFYYGLFVSISLISSNYKEDIIVGYIFSPLFIIIIIVFLVINSYRIRKFSLINSQLKAAQQGDAPEPASPAR